MQACPYDALYIDPAERTAQKCNYCVHRVEIGLQPACVVVCPEQAIIAGDLDDLGFDCDVGDLVLSRAKRALESGCDGVISSGLEVPKDTTVKPITRVEMPIRTEMEPAPDTSRSAALIRTTSPPSRARRFRVAVALSNCPPNSA